MEALVAAGVAPPRKKSKSKGKRNHRDILGGRDENLTTDEAKEFRASVLREAQQQKQEGEEGDEAAAAESFAAYFPTKLMRAIPKARHHPDKLIQSAVMTSVELPDITYVTKIPANVIEGRMLSAPQLETVVYASQRHETSSLPVKGEEPMRGGFFLGDGAGVGKGRQLAGLILENFQQGRKKAVWLSASADLHIDARRDLDDVGLTTFRHHVLKDQSYDRLPFSTGLLFTTYSSLVAKSSTKKKTRLDQIVEWLGKDWDGLLLFDECHKAKNLYVAGTSAKPTKTGQAVFDIQKLLPRARVVYCSATGVSEPGTSALFCRMRQPLTVSCLLPPPPHHHHRHHRHHLPADVYILCSQHGLHGSPRAVGRLCNLL